MASQKSSQFVVAQKLQVGMTLAGHEPSFYYTPDGEKEESGWGPAISYFPDGYQMISGSGDKTARLWDLQAGKEIKEMRIVCEQEVHAVAVSRDGRWVIIAGRDVGTCLPGELKAYDMKKGDVRKFKGHSREIICIDVSMDSKLLASGSWEGTTRIWSLDTGKLVAGEFKSADLVGAIRFSRDSRKVAVNSWTGRCIEVWDIQTEQLEVRIGKAAQTGTFPLDAPVFWTMKDRTIAAAFSFSDDEDSDKIYEFNASTLETVGAPLKGHAGHINDLALSFDCALLASASHDHTIKLWAFGQRQLLASFDIQHLCSLVFSPDARQVAYTTFDPPFQISICKIPPDVLANIWPAQEAAISTNSHRNPRITDPLSFNASHATTRPSVVNPSSATAPFATGLLGCPPSMHKQQSFSVLRHFRKVLPPSFRRHAFQTAEPYDPLECTATSPRPPGHSSSAPIATLVHHPSKNSRPDPALHTSQSPAPTDIISHVRRLLNRWPTHVLPPIVSVPLAQGKERNATAGAPKRNNGYRRDEEFDTPPLTPSSDSQRASAQAQVVTGEHGSGRSCFCF